MSIVAIALCAAVAGIGLVGIVSPSKLVAITERFQSQSGLYAAAAIRLVLGAALFLAAPDSSAPGLLRVLGIVVFVAGLLTPLIGLERFRRLLDWWAGQSPGLMRVWAAFTAVFGLYLVYALAA